MVDKHAIGIIGAGNMGKAILNGFIEQGIQPDSLFVADHKESHCQDIQRSYGVNTMQSNAALVKSAATIILAIKPQQMQSVLQEIQTVVQNQLIISIAAGITTGKIKSWLGLEKAHIVRAMPNTPALIGEGITAIYAPDNITLEQKQQTEQLFLALGKTLWLEDEAHMHVVTALSGSGPAYFYYMMESLIDAGVTNGLSQVQATALVHQTALGSVKMAQNSEVDLGTLRQNVTSKGGTTERGLEVLKQAKFHSLIEQVINEATNRSKDLSKMSD